MKSYFRDYAKEVRYIRHDGHLILKSYDELVIENGLSNYINMESD